jgi:glycogen(starch) synthase
MESGRKLKVWVMTNEFHPNIIGGLGVVATHLANMLSKVGVEVTVLCASSDDRFSISKPGGRLRVVRIPKNKRYYNNSKRTFNAGTVLRAVSAMSSSKPDSIHVHSTDFATTAAEARHLYRIPVVYTCHSMVSKGIASPSGKNQSQLIRIARRIIVPSRWQSSAIKKLYPSTHGRINVIPHGVKTVSKRTYGKPSKLLYVGRLIPSKGIEPLMKAVALLSREQKNVHLTIVGSGHVRYQNSLRTLAKQLGIADRIRWIRSIPNGAVQRIYSSYGAVIVPSKEESFCIVALEAMANGVPLVSTLSGGLKEFVNTRNAQVIPFIDRASIARSIAAMWKNPAKTGKRLINARATAARYRWPAIALRYKSLFTNLRR